MEASSITKTDFDPGLCRCCGELTKFRVINENYRDMGRFEVYSDMIKECFGLELFGLGDSEPSERLICTPCMLKLREASAFKVQVQKIEQKFKEAYKAKSGSIITVKSMTKMTHRRRGWDDEDSDGILPDGFDDELDPEQLEEYYLLGNGIEPHNEGYSSAGDDGFVDRAPHTTPMKTVKQKPGPDISVGNKMYMYNAAAIVKHSYACPFKNRFNHVLCHYCAQYFLRPAALREHTLAHDCDRFKNTRNRYIKIDITRIDCKLCPEKIDNLEDFKHHLMEVHKKMYFPQSKDGVIPYRLVEDGNSCTICGQEFPQFKELVRHMDQHFSNYVCETCGTGFMDEASLQKHLPSHAGRRYPCAACGSQLKSPYTLQCHMRRIHGKNEVDSDLSDVEVPQKKVEEEVLCQGCDQTFKSRKHLAIHVRKDHLNYRHVCQVCGQKFFTRFALNNHMPTHTGERNFKCKVCDKSYPRLKTLKEHMRIHTNDRRYRCHICGQAFIQNCSLKGHMKSKHPEHRSSL